MLTVDMKDVEISDAAQRLVRLDFNPTANETVREIKTLTAALITVCQKLQTGPEAGRAAAIAITEYETAAMFAVKAATV